MEPRSPELKKKPEGLSRRSFLGRKPEKKTQEITMPPKATDQSSLGVETLDFIKSVTLLAKDVALGGRPYEKDLTSADLEAYEKRKEEMAKAKRMGGLAYEQEKANNERQLLDTSHELVRVNQETQDRRALDIYKVKLELYTGELDALSTELETERRKTGVAKALGKFLSKEYKLTQEIIAKQSLIEGERIVEREIEQMEPEIEHGIKSWYRKDGTLAQKYFPDGSSEEYDPSGNLIYIFNRAGHIISIMTPEHPQEIEKPEQTLIPEIGKSIITPDGTETFLDENEKIVSKKFKDGRVESYREDGTLERVFLDDGSMEEYDTEGKLTYKKIKADRKPTRLPEEPIPPASMEIKNSAMAVPPLAEAIPEIPTPKRTEAEPVSTLRPIPPQPEIILPRMPEVEMPIESSKTRAEETQPENIPAIRSKAEVLTKLQKTIDSATQRLAEIDKELAEIRGRREKARVEAQTPTAVIENTKSQEPKPFPTSVIKAKINELLTSKEAKKKISEVVDLKVEGRGEEIILNTDMVVKTSRFTPDADVKIKAVLGNENGRIIVRNYEVTARFETVKTEVEKEFAPKLGEISELLKEYIETAEKKQVEKMEIVDGELKVTFKK